MDMTVIRWHRLEVYTTTVQNPARGDGYICIFDSCRYMHWLLHMWKKLNFSKM